MSKKYKLIQIYPFSPKKLGIIIQKNGTWWQTSFGESSENTFHRNSNVFNPEDYPEQWEEVVEKDYEILSFKLHQHCIAKLCNDGLYHTVLNDQIGKTEGEMLKGEYYIHSVLRKSDGEVFTVGDKAITKYGDYGIIIEFENKFNNIYITTESGNNRCKLKDLKPIKKPLFTTEDGCEIYNGDKYYLVSMGSLNKQLYVNRYTAHPKGLWQSKNNIHLFGDIDNANEYIRKNTKLFTTEDGVDIFEGDKFYCITIPNRYDIVERVGGDMLAINEESVRKRCFSTKEAAEEYILMNKPCLSYNDLNDLFNLNQNPFYIETRIHVKNLIKKRINGKS